MPLKLFALRLIAVSALGVCGVILADYLSPAPAFCGFESGCDSVIFSPYGRIAGVPLPVVGVLAFGSFLTLTLFPGRPVFAGVVPLAVLAGLAGVGLILVQGLVLERFCPLCLLVDTAAIGLGAMGLFAGLRSGSPRPMSWPRRAGWIAFAAFATAMPVAWALVKPPPPVPPQVKAHWVEGKLNVVEVTDFDCDFCRQAHPVLEAFRKELGDRVHFVRLPAPLPKHVNARPAARAYVAAEAQGKGDAMAKALFAARSRAPEDCRKMAEKLGLDMKEYARVVGDPATDEQLDATLEWARAVGRDFGLPLTWVQDQLFIGVPSLSAMHAALRRIERGQ